MTATEPNGWELKRSIDQLREASREDFTDMKADINGLGTKLDAKFDDMERRFPTRSDHNALAGRVTTLETNVGKRSERSTTIWLAIGLTAFTSLTGLATTVITILAQR